MIFWLNAVIRCLRTFRSMVDRVCDGGPMTVSWTSKFPSPPAVAAAITWQSSALLTSVVTLVSTNLLCCLSPESPTRTHVQYGTVKMVTLCHRCTCLFTSTVAQCQSRGAGPHMVENLRTTFDSPKGLRPLPLGIWGDWFRDPSDTRRPAAPVPCAKRRDPCVQSPALPTRAHGADFQRQVRCWLQPASGWNPRTLSLGMRRADCVLRKGHA